MSQRQLASVLFCVVGVFIAGSRLPDIFPYVVALSQWQYGNEDGASEFPQRVLYVVSLIATLLAVLMGLLLVVLRERLADMLFRPETRPVEASELQAVALSVVGCYFVVQGLARPIWAGHGNWGAFVEVALGGVLFFGARGLAGLWSLSRSVGGSQGVGRERG